MSTEGLLFCVAPMAVAAAEAAGSVYSAVRRPSVFQTLAAVVVIVIAAWTELVGYRMLRGAWPTFLVLYAVVLLLPVVGVQLWLALRARPRQAQ